MVATADTIGIDGTTYSLDELVALVGADALEPPINTEAIQEAIREANWRDDALSRFLAATVLLGALSAIPRGDRIYYRRDLGQYTQRGRAITQPEIERAIGQERSNARARMERYTESMIAGRITLADWQQVMARDIYHSHLRMAQAGAGTAQGLTPRHMTALYQRLTGMPYEGGLGVGELQALERFAQQIRAGELSEAMILARARRYGENIGASYYEAEWTSRVVEGGWEAIRRLTGFNHCPECPEYQVLEWTPVENVVPPGVACSCRANCQCTWVLRRRGSEALSDRLI